MKGHDYAKLAADQDQALAELLPHCYPATPLDYAQWLRVYANAGHELGPAVRQSMSWDGDWYILIDHPGRIPALFGSAAVRILIPPAIGLPWHEIRDVGHNRVYAFDPPWTNAWGPPEVHSDVMKALAFEHGLTVEMLAAMAGQLLASERDTA